MEQVQWVEVKVKHLELLALLSGQSEGGEGASRVRVIERKLQVSHNDT